MVVGNNMIECPNCGEVLDIEEGLRDRVKKELEREYSKNKNEIEKSRMELDDEKTLLENAKKEQEVHINSEVNKLLELKVAQNIKQIKQEFDKENSEKVQVLKAELDEKSNKLKAHNNLLFEYEKLKRQLNENADEMKAKFEALKNEEILKVKEEQNHKARLKDEEFKLQKENLLKKMEEMQKQATQGSQQLQGEVQEVVLHNFLKEKFPLDEIEEIKTGHRGADCLQIINDQMLLNCGSIYYESKRTKAFQPSWIEKFKEDMRLKKADIGVLVSDVMPKEAGEGERIIRKGGNVWVCRFSDLNIIIPILREGLIQLNRHYKAQKNKGDKASMVYNFLTSNEFKMQFEAIMDGFSQMKSDLDKEKRAMQRLWAMREKQVEKVLNNTSIIYGSLQGIAGENNIPKIEMFELLESEVLDK